MSIFFVYLIKIIEMEILEKVKINPNICGIQLDFAGELSPEHSNTIQNFYNSTGVGNVWNDSYFGKKTVSFRENSKNSKSGISFEQQLVIKFPGNDSSRSDRIAIFTKVKFVKLILSNGTNFVIGRNDFFQNKRPKIKFNSDEKMVSVTFTTKSIFPIGFVDAVDNGSNDPFNDLLPHDIPITFINI